MMIVRCEDIQYAMGTILAAREAEQRAEDVFVYVRGDLVYAAYRDSGKEVLRLTKEHQRELQVTLMERAGMAQRH